MKKKISEIILELQKGNITEQFDISAIVNAANAELHTGSGVAGAIHNAAGKELEVACRPLAPINPGQAVITDAFNLSNDYVIHTLGPVYGRNHPEDKLLAACYRNSLLLADEKHITSVAFPAISTGAFGYPIEKAAIIALRTIADTAEKLKYLKTVRMVLWSETDYNEFAKVLEKI
jgi:O-acetyl-ADP-ribose deacetylase (regulator of RNase III)